MKKKHAVQSDVWWLTGGTEKCDHCAQRYHYEVQVRCVACDGPLCPQCVVIVTTTREAHCPGCEGEEN